MGRGPALESLSRSCPCEVCTKRGTQGPEGADTQTPRTWLSTPSHPLNSVSLLGEWNREQEGYVPGS